MRRSVIIITCLFSVAVLAIGFILPKQKTLNALNAEINGKKAELRSKEEYFANLSNIAAEFKKYQNQLAKIGSSLPRGQQLPAIFDFIQKASSQSGLVLKNISPSVYLGGLSQAGVREDTLSISVVGSLSSFESFVSILEKSSRLIEIENMSFSAEESPSTFNLTIKTYFY